MNKIRFDTLTRYKSFITDRDKTLEHMYRNHRLKVTDLINEAFVAAIHLLHAKYSGLLMDPYNKSKLRDLDHAIDHEFDQIVKDITINQMQLRKNVYMLAHAGEVEAVTRITGTKPNLNLNSSELNAKAYKSLMDGTNIYKRISVYFSDVRRKFLSAVEYSLMIQEPIDAALGRAFLSLPKKLAYPEGKTALKKIRVAKVKEAAKPKFSAEGSGTEIVFGPRGSVSQNVFNNEDINKNTHRWDAATWDDVMRSAAEEYKPQDRSPESFFDMKNPFSATPVTDDIPEEDKIYSWELEQQLTHDFVSSVREGQIDAANANGINEFMWIAILDNRTCEKCCEWRSGLMTSEIEKVLADDKELADHCDVVVPPAHFNCRCGIAPVALENVNDLQKPETTKDFDAWLNGE